MLSQSNASENQAATAASIRITDPNFPAHLTVPAASSYLGVSERFTRRMIAEGTLPAYRIGAKAIRIKRSDLDALLKPVNAA